MKRLSTLFMRAADDVSSDDALLERFRAPRVLWPCIHQSWDNRRKQRITGRLDFAPSERGLEVYE